MTNSDMILNGAGLPRHGISGGLARNHVEDMKWLKNNMRGNIEEARGFAQKANEMRDKNPEIAELCKTMMRGHLQFEEEGDGVMRKMMEKYQQEAANDPMAPGYVYAVDEDRKDMKREAAKVRSEVEVPK